MTHRTFRAVRAARRFSSAIIALATIALVLPTASAYAESRLKRPVSEDDFYIAGPLHGPVDTRYASPLAARQQLLKRMPLAASRADTRLDPSIYGEWTTLAFTTTTRAIHVTLLRTGKVLLIAGSGNNAADFAAGSFTAELWDPVTQALSPVPPPDDMFCAGHVVEPDGNVLVMGGTLAYPATGSGKWHGLTKTYRFNIETGSWEPRASMNAGRWYPTAVLDPTGEKVLVYAGKDESGTNTDKNEVYDRASDSWSFLPPRRFPLYPGLLWTARNRLFFSGAATGMSDLAPGLFSPYTGAWRDVPGGIDMGTRAHAATVFAGAVQRQLAWLVGGGFPATSSTVLTDLRAASPVSVPGPSLPTAKAYVSTINLPDLTVLETGGGTARKTPVYEASIFRPNNRTLRPVAPPTVGRTYHSSAILLPDGSVATFGGDPGGSPNFELRIEIYRPNYFFKGPRPQITAAPTEVNYGGAYPITASATDAALARAILIRPASTTHSTDSNQRSVLLGFTPSVDGATLTIPSNPKLAPPGWYMLFVTDSLDRPSTATWVHLT